MSKKIEAETVRVYARIYDKELLQEIENSVMQGQFDSKSDAIARCVEYALPILTDKKKRGYDVEHALRQQNAMLRELTVNAVMTMNLVMSLYGERLKTLAGTKTSEEGLANGEYEKLPEYYQERLNELMKTL